jgi:hypothetical protein
MPDNAHTSDSDPQISQTVTGNDNLVIGQEINNFNVKNITVYERILPESVPLSVSTGQFLTQHEYSQRKALLSNVKIFWVKGILETSLYKKVLIELGLQERLDLVQKPFSGVSEFSESAGQIFPEGVNATNVFDGMEAGRTLLILGEPGSGKTITLLRLAENLIARTEQDVQQPIPVVFNLSSWARKPQAVEEWLIQELLEQYRVPTALGKNWVKTENLILLLDGLDEVKADQRSNCVQALNQFLQTHSITEVAICCRIKDYQVLKERLRLRNAICIQRLTYEQVNSYFELAGEQLNALQTVLRQDKELQELAASPLTLNIMSLAYLDCLQDEIATGGVIEDYRKRLFDTYIDRMFQRRGTTRRYAKKETQRWLIWLAQRMNAAAQTIFLIERLQPNWLPSKGQRIRYRLATGFVGGLICGLSIGLHEGHSIGLIYGLISGLLSALVIASMGDIKPIETLIWYWQGVINRFRNGLIYGMICGLILGLTLALINVLNGWINEIIHGLVIGLVVGFIMGLNFGLIFVLAGGFRSLEIYKKSKPNQGVWKSARNTVILGILYFASYGLISGLIASLFFGSSGGSIVGLSGGLLGLSAGMMKGGASACLRHFALRLMLYCQGDAPWNYVRFLDYATDRIFLQKVGGGYIFIHRMLLEHFAEMLPEQEHH